MTIKVICICTLIQIIGTTVGVMGEKHRIKCAWQQESVAVRNPNKVDDEKEMHIQKKVLF